MSKVVYRPIKKEDYEAIKAIINEAFGLHKLIKDKRILNHFLNIYLHSCLGETTFTNVAEKDKKVIGLIFGNAEKKIKKANSIYHSMIVLYNYLTIKLIPSKDRDAMKEFKKMLNAYDELIANRKNDFQGSVTLFAVTAECRGLGIGKHLMQSLLEYVQTNEVRNIYLYTDTICNYGFYESQGFIRLDERNIQINAHISSDAPDLFDVFLYGYKII